MSAQICQGLQIQIITITLCRRVCTHTRVHTQTFKNTVPYTLHSYLYTYNKTHPRPINGMCVHIRVCQSTHALTRSLFLTHILRPTVSHAAPPSYLISHLCCLRARLQQRCHHLQPCSVDYCLKQRQPALLRKSRQQAMSAHYTHSQPATRPEGRVLLTAAALRMMRPSY